MVLEEGLLTVPPWYYTVVLVLGLAGVSSILWAIEPPVTDRLVIAFAPWMMLGSTWHVLYKIEAFPPAVAPLFASPSVYATTAILGGFVWIVGVFLYAGGLHDSIPRVVGISGTAFFSVFAMITILMGYEAGTFNPFWPAVAIVIAGIVTAIAWIALSLWFTEAAAVTGLTGAFVVFSQSLDGVSTAIGYDVLGASEEVPLSRMLLEAGGSLPTAEFIGAGWLFVLLKVSLALAIVWLFTEYVRERPRAGRLVLALVAAVGLGPGVHNVLQFTIM